MPKKEKHSGLETAQPSKTELKTKKKARAGEGKPKAETAAKAGQPVTEETAPKESPRPKAKSKKSSSDGPAKEKAPKAKAPKADKAKSTAAGKKPAVEITTDEIALRAYFIAERRHKMGWPGDSAGDWIEAERQLRQEKERSLRGRRA